MSASTRRRPDLDGRPRARTAGRVRGDRDEAVMLAVATPVGGAQPVRAGTQPGQPPGRTGAARGDQALQRATLELAVTPRGREGGHTPFIGPAAEGVGVHPEEAARLAEGEAFGLGPVAGRPQVGHGCSAGCRAWGRRNLRKTGFCGRPGGGECRTGCGGASTARACAPAVPDQAGTNSWSSRWRPSQSPKDGGSGGQWDRPHDLADIAAAAEQVAALAHPAADAGRVAVELVGTRVDRRGFGPSDRDLGGHDIEQVHPPGRPRDDLPAAVTADRDVVVDDGADRHAHDLHRRRRIAGGRAGRQGLGGRIGPRAAPQARAAGSTRRLIEIATGWRGGPRNATPRGSPTRGPRPSGHTRPRRPSHGRGEERGATSSPAARAG